MRVHWEKASFAVRGLVKTEAENMGLLPSTCLAKMSSFQAERACRAYKTECL